MPNTKTITVARKGEQRRVIDCKRGDWLLPREPGVCEARVGGTGAYREAVARWQEDGWEVMREPNPNYRPPRLFGFR